MVVACPLEEKFYNHSPTGQMSTIINMLDVFELSRRWVWWYHAADCLSSSCWADDLHKLASIDCAEKFWYIYNRIKRPSQLDIGADFYFFKSDILPMWEEEKNCKGGRVISLINRFTSLGETVVDMCWLRLAIACLTDLLNKHCTSINGIFVSSREAFLSIGFWMHSNSTEMERNFACNAMKFICNKIALVRYLPHKAAFEYPHDE